jgi:hypothetical protein
MTTEPVTDTQLANARQIAPFASFEQKASELVETAKQIALLDPNDPKAAKQAREMRLTIKPFRVVIEKRHAELKRDIIDRGRALDEGKNALLEVLKPLEADLLAIEQHAERMEAKRIADLKEAREAELAPFTTLDVRVFSLEKLTEAEYSAFLADCQQQTKDRAAKAEQDKRDAEAKEAAEKAERERVAAENERLRAEVAENERKLADERKRAAEVLAAQAESARIAREAKEAAEQRVRDIEAEAKRAEQARKDEAERVEAKRLAAEEAAAKAPDRDRLLAFAGTIAALTVPPMSTPAGRAVLDGIGFQITKFAAYVTRKAEAL